MDLPNENLESSTFYKMSLHSNPNKKSDKPFYAIQFMKNEENLDETEPIEPSTEVHNYYGNIFIGQKFTEGENKFTIFETFLIDNACIYNIVQFGDIDHVLKIYESNKDLCCLNEMISKPQLDTNLEVIRKIGEGGFGTVYKVFSKSDRKYYAVKLLKLSKRQNFEDVIKEVKALTELSHCNIVRYRNMLCTDPPVELINAMKNQSDSQSSDDSPMDDSSNFKNFITSNKTISKSSNVKEYIMIQMEYCDSGTLKNWIRNRKTENTTETHQLFLQILSAAAYIHSKNLIHRDLKPSNIFLINRNTIKVGDFGLVTEMKDNDYLTDSVTTKRTKYIGTRPYMAPELETDRYNHKVDVYALGIILFEMLSLFSTEYERCKMLERLKNGEFPDGFKNRHSLEADLIIQMISKGPEKRPEILDVFYKLKKSKWFAMKLDDMRIF